MLTTTGYRESAGEHGHKGEGQTNVAVAIVKNKSRHTRGTLLQTTHDVGGRAGASAIDALAGVGGAAAFVVPGSACTH